MIIEVLWDNIIIMSFKKISNLPLTQLFKFQIHSIKDDIKMAKSKAPHSFCLFLATYYVIIFTSQKDQPKIDINRISLLNKMILSKNVKKIKIIKIYT